ncbi:AAA family ATPase [Lysinibacillus fusiformis]|uniref:AAA family ATPase n=1 Tax=Lysinibacillus fusiformis TaxID=28031 RepID=UPI00215ACF15|nr:AAA family ATPase [Lysinibacillus fusiformis]MCR8853679.1 AAA family ATPase [Lysinibacillus fusiformis]WKT76356.1 AAA family ATPase [Lysinibacillus fusiformis]
MKNNYIISRIYLKNFKSIDEARIALEGANLNVLDGPNGFGKTTIYDAIQLLLTGSVRRIESNKIVAGNKGFQDHLFSKDQSLPTEITIEFTDKHYPTNKLVLQRILMPPFTLLVSQKKPQDFSQYKLYKLNSFEDEANKEVLTDSQLNDLFSMKDMSDRFNLYHYIEQEESTHLFKKTDKDRMAIISKLFNIEEETNQKLFLERIRNKIISYKSSLTNEIDKLEVRKDNNTNITEFPYKPFINPERIINVPWDKENVWPLDLKLKQEYHEELDLIKNLILNKEDFKNGLSNEKLDNVINADKKLKAIIILGHFYGSFEKLEKQYQNQEKFNIILSTLKNREILQRQVDWNFIFEYINVPFEKEIVGQRIELIKSYKNNSNTISSVVTQMIQTRGKLELDFKTYTETNPESANECPLCGDSKESLAVLIAQIKEKSESLRASLDASAKTIEDELETLYTNNIGVIIEQIEKWLNDNTLDSAFIRQLAEYKDSVPDMEMAKEWFRELNINIDQYINFEMKFVDDISEIAQSLKQEIQNKKLVVNDFCKENMVALKEVFKGRLNEEYELLNQITPESVKEKKDYIEYQYFLQTSLNFQKAKALRDKLGKINDVLSSINRLIGIYNDKINRHRAKMISDIEIPFYIYTGKIIQNHQRGIGVFIKEEKEMGATGEVQLKSLNFVPPVHTDHDIVHSFSSGQLSSTVIAFTLALNKVYGNSGIMTLLIDDPVQTMDEMNMASFVELLRNDFRDRQLIVSTHEDDISLYLRYKFLKYGLSVGNINVKQALYSK